ncbi:hypothetical protein [Bosea sp. TAF32]|uniref:hypothetical protein n=1 Tax=Bosea sp. TAF32 TaxID=3237482 RepID=UPI003F936864
MSLIVRRAQIRRAAASRKDASRLQEAERPKLRLVFSNDNIQHLKATCGGEGSSRSRE